MHSIKPFLCAMYSLVPVKADQRADGLLPTDFNTVYFMHCISVAMMGVHCQNIMPEEAQSQ